MACNALKQCLTKTISQNFPQTSQNFPRFTQNFPHFRVSGRVGGCPAERCTTRKLSGVLLIAERCPSCFVSPLSHASLTLRSLCSLFARYILAPAFLGARSGFVAIFSRLSHGFLTLRSRCSLAVRGYFLTLRSRFVVCCSSSQGVVVVVVPEAVTGLNGSEAQYLAIACAMRLFVSSLRCLPVLAAAILSFCCCGISLRHTLFAIVFIFGIVIIVYIINIVQIEKKSIRGNIFTSNCLPPLLIVAGGTFVVGKIAVGNRQFPAGRGTRRNTPEAVAVALSVSWVSWVSRSVVPENHPKIKIKIYVEKKPYFFGSLPLFLGLGCSTCCCSSSTTTASEISSFGGLSNLPFLHS